MRVMDTEMVKYPCIYLVNYPFISVKPLWNKNEDDLT